MKNGVTVTGMLVEVGEGKQFTFTRGRRAGEVVTPYYAYVFCGGREAERFEVGEQLDVEEVRTLIGRTIVGDLRIVTKWVGREGERQPRTDVYLTSCAEHPRLVTVAGDELSLAEAVS